MNNSLLKSDELAQADVLTLQQNLLRLHPKNHVCNSTTRLLVEGYPRSSNSFCVDMIVQSGLGVLPVEHIAHHTHSIENVKIAEYFGIPKVILIRSPADAVLSFHIYSGQPIRVCADIYVKFYSQSLMYLQNSIVVDFEQVTSDFRSVVVGLNRLGDFRLNENQDFVEIQQRALEMVRARGKNLARDAEIRQVAAPNEQREILKERAREDVVNYLVKNANLHEIYLQMCATK